MQEENPKSLWRTKRPPVLSSKVILPSFGERVNPFPANLSARAEVTIESTTFTIDAADLVKQKHLGKGNYGHVEKMVHRPTGRIFAVKHLRMDQCNTTKAQMKDLTIGMNSRSPYVTTYYCGLWYEWKILIVMELLDISLDGLLTRVVEADRSIPDTLLAYITFCVVSGLEYLHKELKVIHRDVKPSNLLAKRDGIVKVCDFGISGDLVDSLAATNLGTKSYLAPERIDSGGNRGGGYRIQSDVWSLGLSVFELATGRPCYDNILDLFQQLDLVVKQDPPRLPADGSYSEELCEFIELCLVKEEPNRANYIQLLDSRFLKSVNVMAGQQGLATFLVDFIDSTRDP